MPGFDAISVISRVLSGAYSTLLLATPPEVTVTLSSSQAYAAQAAPTVRGTEGIGIGADSASSPPEEFPVDSCFGEEHPARFADTYHNFDSNLYTFEEFIRCPESSRSTATLDSTGESANACATQPAGEFHSIPLDSARGTVENQPLNLAKYSKRSASYAFQGNSY